MAVHRGLARRGDHRARSRAHSRSTPLPTVSWELRPKGGDAGPAANLGSRRATIHASRRWDPACLCSCSFRAFSVRNPRTTWPLPDKPSSPSWAGGYYSLLRCSSPAHFSTRSKLFWPIDARSPSCAKVWPQRIRSSVTWSAVRIVNTARSGKTGSRGICQKSLDMWRSCFASVGQARQ